MKKKIAIGVVIVALVGVFVIAMNARNTREKNDNGVDKTSQVDTEQLSEDESSVESVQESTGSDSNVNIVDQTVDVQDEINSQNDPDNENRNENYQMTDVEDNKVITFPYNASESQLELIKVYDYSGNYLEDGTDDEIGSVAALEVKNNSSRTIEYGEILLTADGVSLSFHVSLLPAGETALVMEANKQSCNEAATFIYNDSLVAYTDLSMREDRVTLSSEEGNITVTNVSDADISELRLFYKNKIDGIYIGGIAYTAKIADLTAGSSVVISPSHFDSEYGEVMMVRIYE